MKNRRISLFLTVVFALQLVLPSAAFAAGGPAFAQELSADDVSLSQGIVCPALSGIDGSQSVIGAFYRQDGSLAGVDVVQPAAGATQTVLRADLDGQAAFVRVFLTDSTGHGPLCDFLEWTAGDDPSADLGEDAIIPLEIVRQLIRSDGVGGIEPYGDYWYQGRNNITADLSGHPALAYSLSISDTTTFAQLPAGYDPDALIEWGKYPGLNVDILHKYGFTGKGAVVAYVDQPIADHEQYNGDNIHYTNNTTSDDSMHGPAVLSLLAGKDIGTAPDAEVYFYGHASWYADQSTHAECLYQIIEQNKRLPDGERITMVGFSDNINSSEANAAVLEAAVEACEQAGIMVWFCGEYGGMSFLPMSNKDDYRNLVIESWGGGRPELVYVPSSGRTSAAVMGGSEYIYWSSGGLSWAMPYVLGLYGIAVDIDPTLTQEDLRQLIVDTAYDSNGNAIINPLGFICEVLKGVGRTAEARAMLAEAEARARYVYAVMDTAAMTESDLSAVGSYLASITDATVLVADAASFASAQQLYTALRADAQTRGGETVGVQIFGTPAMVPAFRVQYKVQMPSAVDEGGEFLTDLFYSNFENDPVAISVGYNVMDHFAEDLDVDLVPRWPVARVPLEKGEYAAFFKKYEQFVAQTGLERQDLVNFSNPIFASSSHSDDMGTFLKRMHSEFDLLDTPYRLYGNLMGDYPVSNKVEGGFTAENLAAENASGIAEFLINSHGQQSNIDKCYYVDDKEIRESLVNMNTINTVLDDHPYYLDCWTCLNGSGMQNNLTTTALNGQCVGMFSATTIISNNGVNCRDSVEEMAKSNFYYFYYHYLKGLHEGDTRSEAFFGGQRAYAQALLADSKNGIRGEGNYQFNLYNLLAYHNFGVLEPNGAWPFFNSSGYIVQAGQSVPKEDEEQGGTGSSEEGITLTNGNPVGDPVTIQSSLNDRFQSISFQADSYTAQALDNGYIRFTLEYSSDTDMPFSFFNPPNGDVFLMRGSIVSGTHQVKCFDVQAEVLRTVDSVTLKLNFEDENHGFLFFRIDQLNALL